MLHDRSSGCDHRPVSLSLVHRSVEGLFDLLTVLVHPGVSKDVEVLVLSHENRHSAVNAVAGH
ncbi:hypothetical protein [Nonomuraea sp. GTA35]|uniref:hypothetical protein n=1 Tax=Nonomuraea sp. GTA35 TaxID=1676746 RepID=UPI0035C253F6